MPSIPLCPALFGIAAPAALPPADGDDFANTGDTRARFAGGLDLLGGNCGGLSAPIAFGC